jgi:hypothetical protein
MKKLFFLRVLGLASVAFGVCTGAACNVHDNTINIPNASINATANTDVTNVAPNQSVPITVTVQNVYLVDPATTPPAEHTADAGYLQVYLDDVNTTALLVTAQTTFDVTIPPATPPGGHKLICRVYKHDGTPTSTEVNVAITVTATAGADGGVDVVVSVDANTTDAATADVY